MFACLKLWLDLPLKLSEPLVLASDLGLPGKIYEIY